LIDIAACALLYLIPVGVDFLNESNATKIVEEQAKLIEKLVKDGFTRKEATATVIALLNGVAKRRGSKSAASQAIGV
jgi:hypothetical protein